MKLSTHLVLACALGACARRDPGFPVWSEGFSWQGDELRVYFSPQDPSRGQCAGALVRLERHDSPRPSELHLTFLAAPLAAGAHVDAVVTPRSELDHPYVQFPVDPSVFEDGGGLLVHVLSRPISKDGVEISVTEPVLRRN
jgi:hypothetical protein